MPSSFPWSIVFAYLLAINVLLFIAMGMDKRRAKRRERRIREHFLFLLAALGGALGGIVAMRVFHHKTLHRSFAIGMPLLLLLNICCVIGVFCI